MNVAQRIIELRKQRGYSTNKLANLAGISQSHLREIELGQRNPTVDTLSYFCDALEISLEEFFHESSDEINPFLRSSIRQLSQEQQIKLADLLSSILEKYKK